MQGEAGRLSLQPIVLQFVWVSAVGSVTVQAMNSINQKFTFMTI